jgi:PhnB protein
MARLNPYLSFASQARQALEFYQSVLGGKLTISEFSTVPEVAKMLTDPADANLVMHGQLDTPAGLTIMAADTGSAVPYVAPTSGVTVALTGGPADHEYIQAAFDRLSEGATPGVPFALAPWGDHYGQLTDKFGISWMFDVSAQ